MSTVHRELADAKLTRFLRVIGRRPDGYHLLESEMVTLDLCDELEFVPAGETTLEVLDEVAWIGDGPFADRLVVPADGTNLVLRALELTDAHAHVRLRKRIPPGAGLGGGSADAAAALRYAGVTDVDLAIRLGADVPFCLVGGRAMVRGIGERIDPIEPLPLAFVLVVPGFGVSTAEVYAAFDGLDRGGGRPGVLNDLEDAALVVEPRLSVVRTLILETTGAVPTLAGSGSSYFIECAPALAGTFEAALNDAFVRSGRQAVVVSATATGALASGLPPN